MTALFAVVLGLFAASIASAQMPGAGGPQGGDMNAVLMKLFGNVTAFTAKADLRALDEQKKEQFTMSMDMSALDGKMRADVDMAQMKSAELPPQAIQSMKQMGMDRIISITRPDKQTTYIIYPGLKSYAPMPLPKEQVTAGKDMKLEKKLLGKETLDGHPCEKYAVTVTTAEGPKQATVWNATDLKDFPLQIQTTERGSSITIRYKDIQFTKPDAKQFEPPTDFKAYADVQQLTMAAMQKMMGGAAK